MSETKITDPNKERLEPVVEHKVTVRKKSKGQKAVESFLGEEVESVKDHIIYDMVIPSTKDALSNMFGGVIDFFNDMLSCNGLVYNIRYCSNRKGFDVYRLSVASGRRDIKGTAAFLFREDPALLRRF